MKNLLYVFWYIAAIAGIWLLGSAFADNISKHDVINPDYGIKCVVVSRMFNTSVDCWEDL